MGSVDVIILRIDESQFPFARLANNYDLQRRFQKMFAKNQYFSCSGPIRSHFIKSNLNPMLIIDEQRYSLFLAFKQILPAVTQCLFKQQRVTDNRVAKQSESHYRTTWECVLWRVGLRGDGVRLRFTVLLIKLCNKR